MKSVPFKACHLPALLLVALDTLLPHLFGLPLALTTDAGVVATGYEPVELRFHSLARRRGAAEMPAQGLPDWLVYQHGLLLQTNVCTFIMPRFSEGFIFSSVDREDRGK